LKKGEEVGYSKHRIGPCEKIILYEGEIQGIRKEVMLSEELNFLSSNRAQDSSLVKDHQKVNRERGQMYPGWEEEGQSA